MTWRRQLRNSWHRCRAASWPGRVLKRLRGVGVGQLWTDGLAALANQIAPEHLHIATADPGSLVEKIPNAGATFLGHFIYVAVGDYAAGPSHVLPTGGTARFASGLSASDFLRASSVIAFTEAGLRAVAPDIRL